MVNFTELSGGLSVLCGGGIESKAKVAFALYDYNGDGVITKEEMAQYLTSVFKVVYQSEGAAMEEQLGCGPEELAIATTELAFQDGDLDVPGRRPGPRRPPELRGVLALVPRGSRGGWLRFCPKSRGLWGGGGRVRRGGGGRGGNLGGRVGGDGRAAHLPG